MNAIHPQLATAPEKEGALKIAIIIASVAVTGLVVLMRYVKIDMGEGWDVGFLPAVNATLNALTAVALLFSLYFVKNSKFVLHRNANATALLLSVVFLLCYVAYHFTTPEVKFGDTNLDGIVSATEAAAVSGTRTIYLLILISHITLAGILLPFILWTTMYAIVGRYTSHKKLSRFVWPLWMYVAVTGPVVYLMLREYYP
ncbi:DUF420 domain-containing protein [Neolewinella antarctica]|uniref:Membrane protein n=1 Tax=Neolewinella antarctica TaxID=442734 RepID=A0ABX0X7I3_9BACT|nr:DUF420 domain-containing protein [Neolewinella antarctica]NJC25166.1 putative membrane protein [Neolewinella antarctica]